MALQKVLYVFSCTDISHVLSPVGPSLETKSGGIVEKTLYKLSHNICPFKQTEVSPDAFVRLLQFHAGMGNKHDKVWPQSHDNPQVYILLISHAVPHCETNESPSRYAKVKAIVLIQSRYFSAVQSVTETALHCCSA